MTIWGLIFVFCVQWNNLMVSEMIKHRNKPILANKETWMLESGLNKFRTIVSEVSSSMGNPVCIFIWNSLNTIYSSYIF